MKKLFYVLEKCENKHEDKREEEDKCLECPTPLLVEQIIVKNGLKFRYIGCKGQKGKKSKIFIKVNKPRPVGWKWGKDEVYSHIGANVYKCNICEYQTKKQKNGRPSIQQHCKEHYKLEYSCDICKDEWSKKIGKQNHYKYECLSCNKQFKGASGCTNHSKICKRRIY